MELMLIFAVSIIVMLSLFSHAYRRISTRSTTLIKMFGNSAKDNESDIKKQFFKINRNHKEDIVDDVVDFEVEEDRIHDDKITQGTPKPITFFVEYAKSSRAHCKEPTCNQLIRKGTIRFVKHFVQNNHDNVVFYHPQCLLKHLPRMRAKQYVINDVEKVEGFDMITATDQQQLRDLFLEEQFKDPNMYSFEAAVQNDIDDDQDPDDWVDGVFKHWSNHH